MPKQVGAAAVTYASASLVPRRAPHRADEGGAAAVLHPWDESVQHLWLIAEGGHGPFSPLVPVRAMPRSGVALLPLRPRPAVLQSGLRQRQPARATARGGPELPAQRYRPTQACRTHRALARAASTLAAPGGARACHRRRRGRRQRSDAPGLQRCRCSGSTARMRHAQRHTRRHTRRLPRYRHQFARRHRVVQRRHGYVGHTSLPALLSSAVAPRPIGLSAPQQRSRARRP